MGASICVQKAQISTGKMQRFAAKRSNLSEAMRGGGSEEARANCGRAEGAAKTLEMGRKAQELSRE